MIIIHMTVPISAERRAEIEAAVRDQEAATRLEPGCPEFRYFWPVVDDGHLHLWECWENQAALDFHLGTDYSKKFVATIGTLVTGDPESVRYEVA
jgi:quinol monooxygenase YgiN